MPCQMILPQFSFILLYFSILDLFTLTMENLPLHTAYCHTFLIIYYPSIENRLQIYYARHSWSIFLRLLLRYWSLKFNSDKLVISILASARGNSIWRQNGFLLKCGRNRESSKCEKWNFKLLQGSHSTWKTWQNESTPGKPGKIMKFWKI